MADFGLQLRAPQNFTVQAPDAGAMALNGFYAGQDNVQAQQRMGLLQSADGRAQVAQGMDQQRLAIDQQDAGMRQQAFTQAQQDRIAQVTRAKEAQAAMGSLYDKISAGTATAGDIAQVTMAYPELSDGIKQTVDGLAQEQKASYTSLIFQAATALKLGKPEVAAKLFEDHATAAENSGQKDDAAIARAMAETAKTDPAAALGTLGILAQSIDPKINAEVFGATPEWRAMTPDEARARGMTGGQINDKTGEAKSAPTATTIVNTGENSNAFDKKMAESAATRYDAITASAQSAQTMIGDLGALAEIAKGLETGVPAQVMAALGPYAQAVGIDIAGLGSAQAYDSIVARMAPQMRTPGAGASSDFDAKQFLMSLPSLGKTPEGNAIISATLQSIQQQKVAAGEIANRVSNGELTWQQGDKEIAKLENPFTSFNKFKGKGEKAGAGGLTADDMKYLMDPQK